MLPSRREILSGLALGTVSAAMASPQAADTTDPVPTDQLMKAVELVRDRAHAELLSRLHAGKLARPDGYLYTVDVAQFMICLARLGDHDGYTILRDHCVNNLIRDRADDPFTRGFVLWRFKEGAEADATGTTEGLRVAKGLWLGARMFNEPTDADRAITVLRGYGNHAVVDQGIWLVRNYFAFKTRSFASNSFSSTTIPT